MSYRSAEAAPYSVRQSGTEYEDDDPPYSFEPERFSRREVNVELKSELSGPDGQARD